MKFTDGFWRTREGYQVFNAHKVYDHEISPTSLTIHAPYFDVQNRGQTLWGPVLSIRFSSPCADVIKVRVDHWKGRRDPGPRFETLGGEVPLAIQETPEAFEIRSGKTRVVISRGPTWSVEFFHGDRLLTDSKQKNLGYVQGPSGETWVKEQLSLGVGELVYGLGERFTSLTKNGQVVESWNADGGTSSEQAYKAVPFYLTNRGYGVLVNDPGAVSFEVASEKVSRVQFSVPGEALEYFLIGGGNPKAVLENYTTLTGKPGLPPAWSFGLWLTTSFVTNYNENTVNSFVQGMADRDLPLHVFHFDCFWMKEYHWSNFQWDTSQFPDPQAYMAELKKRGLHISVWINPYIAQRSILFDEGMKGGFLVKTLAGDVWQTDTWQPGMALVDFTNPAACRWYASKLETLVRMGVDTFKTDFGERIPTEGVVYHDGSDPVRMHNMYSYLYNKTVYELLESSLGKGKSLVFARSGTAGSQKFPVHWGGDCSASYESMAESLRGGLSLGLSGFGFWSHDISGFEHTATPDIYKRWTAFGLLSTHSRLHGNASYRVPWLFDEEAVDVLRHFTRLKCRLMPYLWSQAVESTRVGLPMMRAMMLEFPTDPGAEYLDRQYMLGNSLLVAPVFRPDGVVDFYLPAGTWTSLLDGRTLQGPGWFQENHGYMSLPVLVRPGSIIAMGAEETRPDYDYAQGVHFQVYGLQDEAEAKTSLVLTDGRKAGELTVRRSKNRITVNANGFLAPWSLSFPGLTTSLGGGKVPALNGTFEVTLP